MKRTMCFVLVLLIAVAVLVSCNYTMNKSGVLAGESRSEPKVKDMLSALAAGEISEALGMMHPSVANRSQPAINQMSEYLYGREGASIEQISINISTTNGNSGVSEQEEAVYRVTMADGSVVYLNVVYFADAVGVGFASFQLVLGVL